MEHQDITAEEAGVQLFVARQPIFNSDKSIFGYEILFRSGFANFFDPSTDQDYASGRTLSDTFMTFGIDSLTGGRKAFLNFTQKHLEEEVPAIFPKDHLVIEILETVEPTPKLVAAVRKMKEAGYTIALDDFQYDPRFDELISLADIIKVDFMLSPPEERKALVKRLGGQGIRFLAEKVETNEDFLEGLEMGYTLFQGYFFAKPQVMKGKDIPGVKLNHLELLKEVNSPDFNFSKVESVIRRDLSLSYKFLRFINSAQFGFKSEVTSIRHALTILGIRGVRTWLSLVALTSLGEDKPKELVITAFIRALFMEKLSHETDLEGDGSDLFLVGLFSVIDAILDQPMEELVSELPLSQEVKDALTGKPNRLRMFYNLMLAYEQGDWPAFENHCAQIKLQERLVPTIYFNVVSEATAIEKNIS